MTQLRYSEEELFTEHDYARPQVVGGHRLHGGFDAEGRYHPPRSLVRSPAIDAWIASLRRRGGDLLPADSSLLKGPRTPNAAQQKLLLREGLGQTFWNNLTITGKIEARGRALADVPFPDFQQLVVEDISEMALGHLGKGLLKAHGLDEGGEPDKGVGGHDVMWFALRDLAFGSGAYPDVAPPERIGRTSAAREAPDIEPRFEQAISFLLNLLLIEFRAEIGFALTQDILRDRELFTERREQAEEAAQVVERIRTDEEIHVRSLRAFLGELRSLTFRTVDGGTRPGHEIIDPLWERLMHWATVEQPREQAEQQRKLLTERILAHADGHRILRDFESLADAPARPV